MLPCLRAPAVEPNDLAFRALVNSSAAPNVTLPAGASSASMSVPGSYSGTLAIGSSTTPSATATITPAGSSQPMTLVFGGRSPEFTMYDPPSLGVGSRITIAHLGGVSYAITINATGLGSTTLNATFKLDNSTQASSSVSQAVGKAAAAAALAVHTAALLEVEGSSGICFPEVVTDICSALSFLKGDSPNNGNWPSLFAGSACLTLAVALILPTAGVSLELAGVCRSVAFAVALASKACSVVSGLELHQVVPRCLPGERGVRLGRRGSCSSLCGHDAAVPSHPEQRVQQPGVGHWRLRCDEMR